MTETSSESKPRPSLREVLADEELLASFEAYSTKHLCNEHLDFFRAVDRFKYDFY
jgi:hypothetical protein